MKTTIELPLLPLRDVVVYPHMVIPLFVGREKSIEALESAMTGDKQILLVAQKNPADDDPSEEGLYRVGTVASVLQLLELWSTNRPSFLPTNQQETLTVKPRSKS